jgi:hypothetical protein
MNQKPRHLGVTKAITNFKNASGDVKFFKLQFHQNLAWMLFLPSHQASVRCSRSKHTYSFSPKWVSISKIFTISATMMYTTVIAAIRQRPLLFNGITGGVLCGTSDAIAQQFEQPQPPPQQRSQHHNASFIENEEERPYLAPSPLAVVASRLDWLRFASAAVIGVFFGGLVYPQAYATLDAIWVGTSFFTVVKKSVVEIATVGIFVNTISMTSRGVLRGDKEPEQVVHHVAKELPTVTKNDCLVWLPYNLLAFSVVPPVLRPTTTAMMEASWQTYISLRSHDYDDHDLDDAQELEEQ